MKYANISTVPVMAKSAHHLRAAKTQHKFPGNRLILLLVPFLFLLASCDEDKVEPAPRVETVSANAGPDQTVQVGQSVTLDASASKDSQSKPLSYTWASIKKPAGSTVTLTNVTEAKPTFVPDLAGEYEWEVTVSSANGVKKDKVMITAVPVTNTPTDNGILSEDITKFRVLTNREADPAKPDYVVTNNIQVKARLVVQPGVIIEFEADKGLEIMHQGFMTAKGTAAQKIIFTGKTKTPGFWKGILFDTNNPLNELDYVEVTYAGSSTMRDMPENVTANVGITGTDITAAVVSIKNSSFTNANGYGLYVLGQFGVFANNTFSGNSGLPLYVTAGQVYKLDAASTFSGTKGIGIGGTLHQQVRGVTWPLLQGGTSYVAVHDLNIEGGVTVAPGVTVEFMADKALYVRPSGSLTAKGTAASPITFTGLSKTKGYWKGIMVMSGNQLNEMDHVTVSYGGRSDLGSMHRVKANVVLWGDFTMIGTNSTLKVTNSAFTHSGGYGMAVQFAGGRLTQFANNSFSHNTGAAMFVTAEEVHKLDAASRLNDNNGYNGLETQGTVAHEQNVVWPVFSDGARYHITDDLIFETGVKIHNTGATHALFEFATDKALYVQGRGYLNAKGSSENAMVIFTGKTYAPGSWKGILFDTNNPMNQLDFVGLNYGGSTRLNDLAQKTSLGVRGTLQVTNSEIRNSGGYGVYVKKDASINADAATANRFLNNLQANYFKEQ
ncbi:PKD domain-containing protein [Pontibacter akesuensis]|uniref:Right handed beta helix region n=1 Tax=Pontibacter akesuensis TaxID=388950 RepID=A0A1I7JH31_9BACT|nr:PKD domain-containing protein [Pontibacter akesuensis]GHA70035.1 hypothetical protein GCM10007389_24050 [Pontibacter akesuensis]SFU84481.1 hypothetical protein SAMN04487941_2864 [Pontibacter akesuensis]